MAALGNPEVPLVDSRAAVVRLASSGSENVVQSDSPDAKSSSYGLYGPQTCSWGLRTKTFETGRPQSEIATDILGRRSESDTTKRARVSRRWRESSVGVYAGFVPVKMPPAPIMAKTSTGYSIYFRVSLLGQAGVQAMPSSTASASASAPGPPFYLFWVIGDLRR